MADNKYLAIGDVHGCSKTLAVLLDLIKSDENLISREIIFVGDYIDRGPDSKGVVDQIIEFSRIKKTINIRGNHEQMMLDVLEGGSSNTWQRNGGDQTLRSYGTTFSNPQLPASHFHFYKNTRFYFDTEDFLFVHGGIAPNLSVADQLAIEEHHEDFLWERSHLKAEYYAWEKTVVFGHTPNSEPMQNEHMIGIDTGCVYKNLPGLGTLTAVLLPERKFITQPCIDNPNPY